MGDDALDPSVAADGRPPDPAALPGAGSARPNTPDFGLADARRRARPAWTLIMQKVSVKRLLNKRRRISGVVAAPFALLGACALQPPYQPPALEVSRAWTYAPSTPAPSAPIERESWWTLLGDPAVDRLVAAGLAGNPTLAEAAARVDQARAALSVQGARRLPSVALEGSASRARDRAGAGDTTTTQTSAALGVALSWELDLWGRVREGQNAARHRLAARDADAEAARLSIIGEIADTALALRACELTLDLRDRDIASRETELTVTRARLTFGSIAPVAVATAASNLASARTDRITQEETCRRLVDALVALSGLPAAEVRPLLSQAPQGPSNTGDGVSAGGAQMPQPPPYAPALPAIVILRHPAVAAAEREVAARWSEIAVTRAERLPRVDLAAALSQQWIRALGSSASYVGRSIGAGLAGPLFDGGVGAASVSGAEASYREAVAQLEFAVRTAVRDVEDALAAQESAVARIETSADALEAARFTLAANTARWRAGSIAQVELEESRRQFNRAQESAITAAADRARAWVALVRRTGSPGRMPEIELGALTPTAGGTGVAKGMVVHDR